LKLLSKTLVFPNPPGVTTAYEYEYYARPTGVDKVRLRFLDVSDDIFDGGSLSFSTDNGRTWRDERPHLMGKKYGEATLRRFDGVGWVDPVEGKLVTLYLEGLFRKNQNLEGMQQYYLNYRVSGDGGRTSLVDERAIQQGAEFGAEHPFQDVWVGRNAVTMSLIPPIVRTKQGHLCLVVSRTILGPDGRYHNPGSGFTWLQEMVLVGRWRRRSRIEWKPVASLSLPPAQSTRGLDESTLTQMPDGTLLLVMRASNDGEGKIPGYKWHATSPDGGLTWSEVKPWVYAGGSPLYSSASMCQIVKHSNGKYYWLGNISQDNPRANLPRDVLYIGEIDPTALGLRKETLFVIDRVGPDDPQETQLSNFYAHEDRETGELVLTMPYLTRREGAWVGDTYRYRVAVEERPDDCTPLAQRPCHAR